MQDKPNKLIWIDAIRVLASFGVVLIHVAADVITEFHAVPMSDWWVAHFYDSLVRGCVSLFVMVSGALLLAPTSETISDFFKKRANRILIPFLVWTALYLIWKKYLFEPHLSLSEALIRAAGNRVYFHLWFFYSLIGIYLVTPVFRLFTKQASKRDLIYFIALWFVVSSLMPFLQEVVYFIWHTRFNFAFPVGAAEGLIGYFILGYFLRQMDTEKSSWLAGFLWLGSFIICLTGTYYLTERLGHYNGLFYENVAPNVVVYVASFFVIIKNLGKALQRLPQKAQTLLLQFSKASFGIYLIHPMIMEAIEKGRWGFVMGPLMRPAALTIPATTIMIYFISFGIVWLIQKTPYLRRIV